MTSKELWVRMAISAVAAGPVGGFLFGITHAGDPDPNPIGRVVYACMMAVVTPIHGGFPPHNDAGTVRTYNAWPYIAVAGILVLGWLVYRDARSGRANNSPGPIPRTE